MLRPVQFFKQYQYILDIFLQMGAISAVKDLETLSLASTGRARKDPCPKTLIGATS